MAVKAKLHVDEYIERQLERMQQATIRSLAYVGEACLNTARSTNSYKDQTGNLRSSIGYVVVYNGRVVKKSDFQIVENGNIGSADGEKFAERMAKKFPRGAILLFVAGMNYAVYVKNMGYDVIDSAELLASQLLKSIFSK